MSIPALTGSFTGPPVAAVNAITFKHTYLVNVIFRSISAFNDSQEAPSGQYPAFVFEQYVVLGLF
jgi:hypothetical protein